VLGLSGALTGLRYVRSLLFNVAPADPWGLATAALVVALAALLGCVIPTLRAVRVDPAVALRYD
jgi:ABC-type lipoprotein release transport system permease subunit